MSDEVSNFLRSVEQLKDRRLEEDEARSRELEERIMQEKRERQARRAGESCFSVDALDASCDVYRLVMRLPPCCLLLVVPSSSGVHRLPAFPM